MQNLTTLALAVPEILLGAIKCKMGHLALTTPLLRVICHSLASTYYAQPICPIWTLYLHPLRRYERWHKMSKLSSFGVVRGHPRSLKIAPFDSLLAFHSYYAAILHRFWDIAKYWSKIADLNLPHFYHTLGVIWLEFRRDFWHQKTRVPGLSYGVVSVILGLVVFVQLRLVTDRRTDRHTMRANTVIA